MTSTAQVRLDECTRMDQLIDFHARARPDEPAIEVRDRATTYGALALKINQLTQRLIQAGLQAGDRIALLAKNDVSFCELMMAASKIGVILVPINFRLAAQEIEFIIKDSQAKLLFTGPDFVAAGKAVLDHCAGVDELIDITAQGDYGGWLSGAKDHQSPLPALPDGDTILFQMYTSGTTGQPKAALISQTNVLALLRNGNVHLGPFEETSVSLVCMPLFHIAGCAWLFFGLAAGCRNILVVDIDPNAVLKMIDTHQVTCSLMVPAVIHMVTTAAQDSGKTIPNLKTLVFGASPMPAELLKRAQKMFPNTDFVHVYGLTETTGMFTALPASELRAGRRLDSCGKAIDGAVIRIVDAQGNDVAPGAMGEIICQTPQLMQGYWQRAEATAQAIRNGWFHTGDAGSLDEDGFLYIRDRIKDMIITGGENVYPAEVENALLGHDAVAEAAVIGVADEKWGETVLAAIVTKSARPIDADDIKTFVRTRLAGFKVPKYIKQVDQLPRNAAGKVTKHILREQLGESH